MKIIHISDLHLGKTLHLKSMLEDQKFILSQISDILKQELPEALLIAGDIYDRSIASVEAITLFENFLAQANALKIAVFIISGNHDSPQRLSNYSSLIKNSNVHIAKDYKDFAKPITLKDSFGAVNFYLLPFIKPQDLAADYPEEKFESYTKAVETVIKNAEIDFSKRNVLLSHQFVTNSERSESEISVGGSDNVDVSVFKPFDYTALGHLHKPQNAGAKNVRYSGSPLKYSFSEANHNKSITIAELMEKGNIQISQTPLKPMRDMLEIRGTYDEVTNKAFYSAFDKNSYIHITLTDEEDVFDALAKLRSIYPNILKLDYDNKRTAQSQTIKTLTDIKSKTPLDLLKEFYKKQNNQEMSEEQEKFSSELIEDIWEGK